MPQRGFSLIEILVVVAILGVLAGIGIPSFVTMINSNRSKSAAESATSGLRLARAEAIGRNAPMRFQLVSSLDATCTLSTSSVFWVVTQTNQGSGGYDYGFPDGHCDAAAAVPAEECTSGACGGLPFIAHKSTGNNFPNVVITADHAVVTFGPLGQVLSNLQNDGSHTVANPNNALSSIDFTVPTDPNAKAWRVRVTALKADGTPGSGAIKLCDPSPSAITSMAC